MALGVKGGTPEATGGGVASGVSGGGPAALGGGVPFTTSPAPRGGVGDGSLRRSCLGCSGVPRGLLPSTGGADRGFGMDWGI